MLFFKKKSTENILLTDFIYSVILQKKNKTYKRKCRNLCNHINRFTNHTGIKVYLNTFNDQTAEEFIYYLRSEGRIKGVKTCGTGLMANTVISIFQSIEMVLNKARKMGYKIKEIDVRLRNDDSNAVYLTNAELLRINELQRLSHEAQAVRDRFLLGCYTALRYSDYSKLSSNNIIGNNIVIKTRKTGANVVIPIHPVVRQILIRNSGEFPPLKSAQAFNTCIKRICKKAEITEDVLCII